MKVYIPTPITSAEQAESLPEGTIATHDEHWPAERCTPNRWESSARDMKHEELVGWTALVPIEAEEEWALIYEGQEPTPCIDEVDAREWARIDGEGQAPSRRYTTTWEETP